MVNHIQKISTEFSLSPTYVAGAIKLMFEEDCTIPFVARYRKEVTGSMDEVNLRNVRDRYAFLVELENTKVRYLKVVEEHCKAKPELEKKFPELKAKFLAAETKQQLDDLYLPFKPKRRTKAQAAREMGLEPLFQKIMEERSSLSNLLEIAKDYLTPADAKDVDPKLVVSTPEKALQCAGDILAETISENAELRSLVRAISFDTAELVSTKIEYKEEKNLPKTYHKYENYFDYREPISKTVSHRVMAIRRGEAEKCLRVNIDVNAERIMADLHKEVIASEPTSTDVTAWMVTVLEDAYRRLLSPSIETEIRMQLKSTAEEEAIKVFSENLENLLLLPPIPGKTVMGVDPGLRTGSKLAVVDATGKLLEYATIYPTPNRPDAPKTIEAKQTILAFIAKHNVEYLAIGNGTGSKEIDQVCISVIKENKLKDIKRLVVNESGASVYSTDDIAREEFPDLDPTIRSAVSIARRLQDPLAELVKIDPRSIGVGQYQHDINLTKLNRSLGETVESCVNRVGVNVNTASYKLLSYVSGISGTLAKNIVKHRDQKGAFDGRKILKDVSGFGPKAFQQAAGFLRVPSSENPLDNSGVHPESYQIVDQVAKDLGEGLLSLVGKSSLVDTIAWEKYVSEDIGLPTLLDIGQELAKPGRDPRESGTRLTFSDDVSEISDLRIEMKLKGTVTNVTNFGAFVDIGVHQDGLIHVSELSDEFVSNPADVVSVGDVVDVVVLDVDTKKKRISLSRKTQGSPKSASSGDSSRVGASKKPKTAKNRPTGGKGSGKSQQQENFSLNDLLGKFNR
jgi:uncharacterized protein